MQRLHAGASFRIKARVRASSKVTIRVTARG